MLATEKSKKDGEIQVATLLTLLGSGGIDIVNGLPLSAADRKDPAKVKAAFSLHFKPRVNEVFERYRFYGRTQGKHESFDTFLTSLRGLVTSCSFADGERDKALRDRIVMGVNSEEMRKLLLNETDLDLEKAAAICRRHEATQHYAYNMRQTSESVVAAVKELSIRNCKFCGGAHERGACPAYGKLCHECGQKSHFKKCCKAKKKQGGVGFLIKTCLIENIKVETFKGRPLDTNGPEIALTCFFFKCCPFSGSNQSFPGAI